MGLRVSLTCRAALEAVCSGWEATLLTQAGGARMPPASRSALLAPCHDHCCDHQPNPHPSLLLPPRAVAPNWVMVLANFCIVIRECGSLNLLILPS